MAMGTGGRDRTLSDHTNITLRTSFKNNRYNIVTDCHDAVVYIIGTGYLASSSGNNNPTSPYFSSCSRNKTPTSRYFSGRSRYAYSCTLEYF